MFNIGDAVLIRAGKSTASNKYNGKTGKVTEVNVNFVRLDIDIEDGGLWNDEVSLVNMFYTNLLRKPYVKKNK